MLQSDRIRLRPVVSDDIDAMVRIRTTPEVWARWMGEDVEADVREAIELEDLHYLAIEDPDGTVIGGIQWEAETDPDHRHAGIDIYLDPSVHGQGICTEAVRMLANYLFVEVGHHRITIDPSADNAAAIRCYEKVGFKPVGIIRQAERGPDGSWHDGLLMDLLVEDLAATEDPGDR